MNVSVIHCQTIVRTLFFTANAMEVDKAQKVYNKKTKQDEDGHYPEWMNQRAVKKQKKKLAKSKKKPGKKIKW